MPGTSIGTKEAETYLKERKRGVGRWRAGKVFFEKGMKSSYVLVFERAFQAAVDRGKAIFADAGDQRLNGISWIHSVTGEKEHPILSFNQYCLEHRKNAICITRFSIHSFGENKAGKKNPHNNANRSSSKDLIDSW